MTEKIKQQIEDAIRGTLVIENKQSIYIAVEKIVKIIEPVAQLDRATGQGFETLLDH